MRKIWKKVTGMVLCGVLLFGCVGKGQMTDAQAKASWPSGPGIEAPNAIVMEVSTGTVLYEKEADQKRYPASITKILTTLLLLENSKMDEVVTFSEDAVYKNRGSGIWRDVGERLTMEQCLYAIMLESANECSYAAAEHVTDGHYSKFIQMMNERAKALGCKNTHFDNCNGLPDKKHWTTCRDMALIASDAIKNETFRKIMGTKTYTIPKTNKNKEKLVMYNHHKMISANETREYLYEYCIGGKTGWTSDAGNTLVTFAQKDGMLLVCVVMKEAPTCQYTDTRKLFDYCFENFKMCSVAQSETRYESEGQSEVSLFTEGEAFAQLDKNAQIVLPKSAEFQDTETTVSYDRVTDSVVGTLVYHYNGRQVGIADIRTTGASVQPYKFGKHTETGKKSSQKEDKQENKQEGAVTAEKKTENTGLKKVLRILLVVVIIIAALLVIWFLYNNIYRIWRRKRRRNGRYKTIKNNRKWNKRGRR